MASYERDAVEAALREKVIEAERDYQERLRAIQAELAKLRDVARRLEGLVGKPRACGPIPVSETGLPAWMETRR